MHGLTATCMCMGCWHIFWLSKHESTMDFNIWLKKKKGKEKERKKKQKKRRERKKKNQYFNKNGNILIVNEYVRCCFSPHIYNVIISSSSLYKDCTRSFVLCGLAMKLQNGQQDQYWVHHWLTLWTGLGRLHVECNQLRLLQIVRLH